MDKRISRGPVFLFFCVEILLEHNVWPVKFRYFTSNLSLRKTTEEIKWFLVSENGYARHVVKVELNQGEISLNRLPWLSTDPFCLHKSTTLDGCNPQGQPHQLQMLEKMDCVIDFFFFQTSLEN